jgi:hypothetical protein
VLDTYRRNRSLLKINHFSTICSIDQFNTSLMTLIRKQAWFRIVHASMAHRWTTIIVMSRVQLLQVSG